MQEETQSLILGGGGQAPQWNGKAVEVELVSI